MFALFNKELFGPEPGELIDQEGLAETLEFIGLDADDSYVQRQFRRWWAYYGGAVGQTIYA